MRVEGTFGLPQITTVEYDRAKVGAARIEYPGALNVSSKRRFWQAGSGGHDS